MKIILFIVFVVSLMGIIVSTAGCENTATTAVPNRPSPTEQPAISTQIAGANEIPPTTQATTPPIITHTPVSSQTPTPTSKPNIIIDHSNWDWYNSQPSSVFESVAQLKIFFAHASVGANVLQGIADLNSSNPSKYPLTQITSGDTPPSTTTIGVIYQYDRGNAGWSVKIQDFENYLKNGWNGTKVNLVMNKFCYIDQNADWTAYRNSMIALEAKYPGTTFIYFTMPLTTTGDSDEILRSQFNQNLRSWIATQNNKILFDIADIESWSPDRQIQTFTNKGVTYPKLYEGYSSDGGHLNANGMNRMATGLYSLFGQYAHGRHALAQRAEEARPGGSSR